MINAQCVKVIHIVLVVEKNLPENNCIFKFHDVAIINQVVGWFLMNLIIYLRYKLIAWADVQDELHANTVLCHVYFLAFPLNSIHPYILRSVF